MVLLGIENRKLKIWNWGRERGGDTEDTEELGTEGTEVISSVFGSVWVSVFMGFSWLKVRG